MVANACDGIGDGDGGKATTRKGIIANTDYGIGHGNRSQTDASRKCIILNTGNRNGNGNRCKIAAIIKSMVANIFYFFAKNNCFKG